MTSTTKKSHHHQEISPFYPKPVFARKIGPVKATFIARPNRFLVVARLNSDVEQVDRTGDEITAHLADPGRLKELLVPNTGVYVVLILPRNSQTTADLVPAKALKGRKTFYNVVLVEHDGLLVSLDSRLPNELMYEALKVGFFPELLGYSHIKREVTFKNSRFDFYLSSWDESLKNDSLCCKSLRDYPSCNATKDCFMEVKSVTLVEDGLAKFPDAPTTRGKRHLKELAEAVSKGFRAIVIFIIQRCDALSFTVNQKMDPEFANALIDAMEAGVEVWAYRCHVSLDQITLETSVPINI